MPHVKPNQDRGTFFQHLMALSLPAGNAPNTSGEEKRWNKCRNRQLEISEAGSKIAPNAEQFGYKPCPNARAPLANINVPG